MIRGKLLWMFPILLALVFSAPALGGSMPVKMKRQGNRVEVSIGGQPFTAFYFGPEAPKPYLHPLRSAQGVVVTRGFPMRKDIPGESADHPHHRALYFAHGDINGIDFWSEAQVEEKTTEVAHGVQYTSESLPHGRTVYKKLEEMRGGKDSGTLRASFNLVGPDGKAIAEATQAYTFRGDEGVRIIDGEFTVKALDAPVKMGDTKEGTFAIRVVKALEEPGGRMLKSEGAVGEKQIWGKRAAWVDYSGSVEGKSLGIAIFDHASNPKHPTYWH
ncbi:MAG: PmoA family protein, partial [Betaproteobacteria bacterium]|nr:PmoA family protein [Betaproteobacteria bacterium]